MTVIKIKEGEIVRKRICPNKDAAHVFQKARDRLERMGYFFESGFDFKTNGFWIIMNTGDNCTRFVPDLFNLKCIS